MDKFKCKINKCDGDLEYKGDAGQPGFGKFYECNKCGESHWTGGRDEPHPTCSYDMEDMELSPNDVI